MNNIDIIKEEVTKLLCDENSGHGMEHVNSVCRIALSISDEEANQDIVAAIALLHDADDYKLFGAECAENLTNTKMILSKTSFSEEDKNKVIDSIKTIGYSKRLSGITPSIKETMIVSDADMIDAMGANGVLRAFQYNLAHNKPFFDKDDYPDVDMDADTYKAKNKGTAVNHVFEKLLKLRDLMLTDKGREEASRRYDFLVEFLREYFHEEGVEEWEKYLDEYLDKYNK